MSLDIIIAIDQNVHDPLTMGQTNIVSEIFNIASDILKNGGKVIVQRQYDNAPADTVCIFTKQEELGDWKERLNGVQIILDREKIA